MCGVKLPCAARSMVQDGDIILSSLRDVNKLQIKHLISQTPDPALEVTKRKRHPAVLWWHKEVMSPCWKTQTPSATGPGHSRPLNGSQSFMYGELREMLQKRQQNMEPIASLLGSQYSGLDLGSSSWSLGEAPTAPSGADGSNAGDKFCIWMWQSLGLYTGQGAISSQGHKWAGLWVKAGEPGENPADPGRTTKSHTLGIKLRTFLLRGGSANNTWVKQIPAKQKTVFLYSPLFLL